MERVNEPIVDLPRIKIDISEYGLVIVDPITKEVLGFTEKPKKDNINGDS